MSVPLFQLPVTAVPKRITSACNQHIDQLREVGELDSGGELVAEILLVLTSKLDEMTADPRVKAYSISQISAQVLTWFEKLPELETTSDSDHLDLASVLAKLPSAS